MSTNDPKHNTGKENAKDGTTLNWILEKIKENIVASVATFLFLYSSGLFAIGISKVENEFAARILKVSTDALNMRSGTEEQTKEQLAFKSAVMKIIEGSQLGHAETIVSGSSYLREGAPHTNNAIYLEGDSVDNINKVYVLVKVIWENEKNDSEIRLIMSGENALKIKKGNMFNHYVISPEKLIEIKNKSRNDGQVTTSEVKFVPVSFELSQKDRSRRVSATIHYIIMIGPPLFLSPP